MHAAGEPRPLERASSCRQYFLKAWRFRLARYTHTDSLNDLRYRGMAGERPWRARF